MLAYPLLEEGNELDDTAIDAGGGNPALIHIVRVPKRARGLIAQGLSCGRVVVAEFLMSAQVALRIIVDAEDIKQALAVRRFILMELVEQPGNVERVVMGYFVGSAEVVLTKELLVFAAVKIPVPSPLFRTEHNRAGINRLNRERVVAHLLEELIHAGSIRMHVTVRSVPDGVLVIEKVVLQAALIGRSPFAYQVLYPLRLYGGAVGHVGDVGIVASDVASIGQHTVTAVGIKRIKGLLRRVYRLREAARIRMARAGFGQPINNRDRHHGLRAATLGIVNELIGVLARRAAADTLKEII